MLPATQARRRLAATLATTLTALALGASVNTTAAQAATTTPAKASASPAASTQMTAAQASIRARETGKAVAVVSAETSTSELTANANGSYTLNQYVEPVRKLVDGTWKPLDSTLRLDRATNTISPAVSTSSLSLSDGGRSPLAVMRSGASTLTLSLPANLGTLPAPELSGGTATYANIVPGVDLKMTADTQGGCTEVLVVRNAAAAANPALKSLVFPASVTGATLSSDAAGNITATTAQGRTMFSASAPLMWDSRTPAAGTKEVTDPATGARVDAATGQPIASSAAEPGQDARVARVTARADSHAITLVPDASMLAGVGTTGPLYIAADYSAGGKNQAWTFVDSYYASASYWGNTGATAMHVGDEAWSGPYSRDRTFAQFQVLPELYGATVSASTFYATETWSASCTAEPVQLWWTGAISSGTTWNNQPSSIAEEASENIASGWSSSCPAGSIGWSSKALATVMQTAANGKSTNVTLGLIAGSETNPDNWEEFDPSTFRMATTYDHTPNAPTALSTNPASNCSGDLTTLGNGSVTLIAGVSSPDGGTLTAEFRSWESADPSVAVLSRNVSAVSGTNASLIIPEATLIGLSGKTTPMEVSWDVLVTDGTLTSGDSRSCEFYFNPASPGAPSISDASGNDCNSSTLAYTVGDSAGFTLAPNASGAAPSSYLYQLNGGAPVTTSSTSIAVTPSRHTNVLTVTEIGAGGNIGNAATCTIEAGPAATASDGDLTGDGLPDLITTGNQADLPSGLWFADGQSTGVGQVDTAATDIGAQGTGVDTAINGSSPTEWNGLQAFTGHFAGAGTGFNDVLDYNPSTGIATVLDGNGDGSPLQIDNEFGIPSGAFTDTASNANATHLANGGNLVSAGSGAISISYPDLLMTIDGSLYLQPAEDAGQGVYSTFGTASNPSAIDLLDTNPTGTGTWAGWTITTSLVNDLPAMFARNDSTGALYYYSPTAMEDLASNAINQPSTPITVTPVLLTSSGWSAASYPVIEAADFSSGSTPGIWGVSPTGTVSAAALNGTTLSAGASEPLTADSHTWPLDDIGTAAAGSAIATAADTSGSTALTLTGSGSGVTWDTSDANFPADAALNGTSTGVLTATQAVNVDSSFTASVWAKPTADNGIALAQGGTYGSGFILYPGPSGWEFCMETGDSSGYSYNCAVGGADSLGVWSHVTGTYNSTTQVMTLYIGGQPVATTTHTPVNAYTGKFLVGEQLYRGAYASQFTGSLSNIELWGQALTQGQVATQAGSPGYVPATTGQWELNDGTGSTAADSSGSGHPAALGGGTTWTWDSTYPGEALSLNGSTGYASTATSVLDTSKSMTASVWVKLNGNTGNSVLLSQNDATGNANGFELYYSSTANAWAFDRMSTDSATAAFSPIYGPSSGVDSAQLGAWTQLTGVFNASSNLMQLYVDGTLVSSGQYTGTVWDAAGDLQIGRAVNSGGYSQYANANLSQVNVWNSALTANQISALYQQGS